MTKCAADAGRDHERRHGHHSSARAFFAGHDEGAENWACIASLIETCKLNDADPQAYFADVLTRLINLWPASLLDQLMPWVWAAEHSNQKLAA